MKTPRVFIVDTNVLIAGLLSSQPDSPTVRIVDAMLDGRLIFLLTPQLLNEYRSVLLRPKLISLHGLYEEDIDAILTEITANAIWHELVDNENAHAPDPGDDHLWAFLEIEQSAILITGDRLLYENPPPQRSVITPKSYVDLFLDR